VVGGLKASKKYLILFQNFLDKSPAFTGEDARFYNQILDLSKNGRGLE